MTFDTSSGYLGKLAVKKETNEGEAVTVDTPIEISSETLTQEIDHEDVSGMTGTRSRTEARDVQTLKKPGGDFNVNGVLPDYLGVILECLLGSWAAGSGFAGTASLAESLPSFTTVVDKVVKRMTYAGCKFTRGEFSSSQDDQPLKLAATVIAMTEAQGDAAFPSLAYSSQVPMIHAGSSLTIGEETVRAQSLSWFVANTADEAVFRNSQTRLTVPPLDREVGGTVSCDWNDDNYHLYTKFLNHTSAEIVSAYTNGAYTMTVTMPQVKLATETGKISGRETLLHDVPFRALASDASARDEISIVIAAA